MTIKILQTITHLKLSDVEFYKTNSFILSSNQHLKREQFSHPLFEKAVGAMRYKMIHSNFDYAFSLQESEPGFIPNDITTILGVEMDKLQQFVNGLVLFLWFIKDNSVNATEIYDHVTEDTVHSFLAMSPVSFISNCHAEKQEVSFNKDEIDQAYTLSQKYISICPQNPREFNDRIQSIIYSSKNINDGFTKGENENINYNTFNRIERAIKFLQIARETNYLPRKISMYMPIFECLFL